MIRILLADDHTVVRKGLCLLLDSHPGFKVIAEAANGREAVAKGKYADGATASRSLTVDVISDLLPGNQGGFLPGVTRACDGLLPLDAKGNKPVSLSAHLTMLVFEDDTAMGDHQQIARFTAIRKSMAASQAEQLQQVDAALKDPSPKGAMRTVVADREAKGQHGGYLQQVSRLLDSGARPEDIAAVRGALLNYQQLLAAHANLEEK